jgi:hypothetical protein
MPIACPLVINVAVEGIVDEVVAGRLAEAVGGSLSRVYGKEGKVALLRRLSGYNKAAEIQPWFVLVDLDHDEDCPPPFRRRHLPSEARLMCFRVETREVEAWLLADREGISWFLSVGERLVPADVEALDDPKAVVVGLARRSRRRDIRDDMVPRPGSGRKEGPAYASRPIEFAQSYWRPEVAAGSCESLRRSMKCLRQIVGRAQKSNQT